MVEVTTREFTRNFACYRARASHGERIRISSPEGAFIFAREPRGLPVSSFLQRVNDIPGDGLFVEEGAARIREARAARKPARSPWG